MTRLHDCMENERGLSIYMGILGEWVLEYRSDVVEIFFCPFCGMKLE